MKIDNSTYNTFSVISSREILKNQKTEHNVQAETETILDGYHELCKKYPEVTFRLSDVSNYTVDGPNFGYKDCMNQVGENFGYLSQYSLEIDAKVIEKMQNDPTYKERLLYEINFIKDNYKSFRQSAVDSGDISMFVSLTDNGGNFQLSRTQTGYRIPTEDEIRNGIIDTEYKDFKDNYLKRFEKKKNDLIDNFMKMVSEHSNNSVIK